jgi:dCMP deaminase
MTTTYLKKSAMGKWDKRMFDVAELHASWSKDPSSKVGCVIVDQDRHEVGHGYNGFPQGVEDREDRYANRTLKYLFVVHAEKNAIMNAVKSVRGCTLYCTFAPCASCAGMIIQAKIQTVIAPKPPADFAERWKDDLAVMETMFAEAGVELILVD